MTSGGGGRRAAEILDAATNERWRRYRECARACRRSCSERNVHDLRVATRRLLAVISVVEIALGVPRSRTLRNRLKKRLRAFGPLRDLQVQILFCRRNRVRLAGVETLEKRLMRKMQLQRASVRRRAARWKNRRLASDVARLRTVLLRRAGVGVSECLSAGLDAAFVKMDERRRLAAGRDPSLVHAFRIALKKYRYVIECISTLLRSPAAGDLPFLQGVQQALGRVQDYRVLEDFLADAGIDGPMLSEIAAERGRAIDEALALSEELGGLRPRWLPRFAAPERMGA